MFKKIDRKWKCYLSYQAPAKSTLHKEWYQYIQASCKKDCSAHQKAETMFEKSRVLHYLHFSLSYKKN